MLFLIYIYRLTNSVPHSLILLILQFIIINKIIPYFKYKYFKVNYTLISILLENELNYFHPIIFFISYILYFHLIIKKNRLKLKTSYLLKESVILLSIITGS